MPASLYDVLGIKREASAAEVRAALRAQIRRHYAKSQRGTGDVEEALRLINQASHTLLDPALRARYDRELMVGGGGTEGSAASIGAADDLASGEAADAGDTSEPQPWRRLGARLLDYALWGLVLGVLLPTAEWSAKGIGMAVLPWLMHPLLAPVLIVATWIPVESLLVAVARTTPGKWLFGIRLRFAISDAYAGHGASSSLGQAGRRALRVWWQGMACGVVLLVPFSLAIAYRRLVGMGETRWDSDADCLVTQQPFGIMAGAGVLALAAATWLYGNAWRGPAIDTLAWVQQRVPVTAVPTLPSMGSGFGSAGTAATTGAADPAGTAGATGPSVAGRADAPIDPQLAALFEQREARVAALRSEGLAQLELRQYGKAASACREWAELQHGNAKAWRCLGLALEGQGQHREAIAALRRAKQYDPADPTIDADIGRNQAGVVDDFRRRGGS